MKNGITLFREKAGLTKSELARRAGMNRQQLGRLEDGKRTLSREWAEKIAPILKTTPHELMFPEIARLDVDRYSAIYDMLEQDQGDIAPVLSISHAMFARMVPSSATHRMQLMFVEGDDVSSQAKHGDALIIDIDDTAGKRPGIYALDIGGEPQWRFLSPMTTGTIRVSSDDAAVSDEIVEPETLHIIGRAKLRISAI